MGYKIMSKSTSTSTVTNFENVSIFNAVFKCKRLRKIDPDIFDNNPKLVAFRMALIREEVAELEEAVKTKDMVETIDALADILYVVYGMADALGIDADKAFKIVHRSNMSKACVTQQEAEDTVMLYKQEGRYADPVYEPCVG